MNFNINISDILTLGSYIVAIALGAGAIVTAIAYIKAKYKAATTTGSDSIAKDAMSSLQATVEALKTQNDLQARQIEAGLNDRKEQDKKIATLIGKVDTLSTIPLDKIEKHMQDTNIILQSFTQLLPNLTIQTTTKTALKKVTQ